jgi:hypothetical protein
MIIKITRENSSYRERQREREKTYIFLYICGNQPTNQPTPLRARRLLPTKTETASSSQGSKAPLARWLVGRMRDLCDRGSSGDIFLAFEREKNRNRNRNRNLCETRTWSFLSIPLQNRVGCVRGSERASVTAFLPPPLRVLSWLLLRLRLLPV